MDSWSTDVDVHAFVPEMEHTHQNLSRMNSGLSTTSRSTIHRVPPSPPSRPAELSDPDIKVSPDQRSKNALPHRLPPSSIPDSGYGTEQRRCSLGELPAGSGQEAAAKPLTPPSTAEAAGPSQKTQEAFAWGDSNPFQRQPSTLSPRHSQPGGGFLTDQEMADYNDDSFNLFYQDNHLHSRSSPLGFTFDYPSQVE
jgi:hypothetical protein